VALSNKTGNPWSWLASDGVGLLDSLRQAASVGSPEPARVLAVLPPPNAEAFHNLLRGPDWIWMASIRCSLYQLGKMPRTHLDAAVASNRHGRRHASEDLG
jgi:hypothetical protein